MTDVVTKVCGKREMNKDYACETGLRDVDTAVYFVSGPRGEGYKNWNRQRGAVVVT